MAEFTGRISQITISFDTGKPVVALEMDGDRFTLLKPLHELRAMERLTIKMSKFREKRSLDANSYYWCLIGKLSKALKISTSYCHNLMLRRYGVLEEFDGKVVYLVIRDTEEAAQRADEDEITHLKPTSNVREGDDGMYRTYLLLKGSSKYTKDEFRHLIDGLVDECKNVGIETATPDELAKMMSLYKEER